MSLFIFTWVAIGLFFATQEILMLKNTTPRMMDFFVYEVKRLMRESKEDVQYSDASIEFLISSGIAAMWIIIWPVLIILKAR